MAYLDLERITCFFGGDLIVCLAVIPKLILPPGIFIFLDAFKIEVIIELNMFIPSSF
jgi:hypothetical protein